jgi:UDP-N-acetylglucosamine 2-epimerase (non-hydrolysing)
MYAAAAARPSSWFSLSIAQLTLAFVGFLALSFVILQSHGSFFGGAFAGGDHIAIPAIAPAPPIRGLHKAKAAVASFRSRPQHGAKVVLVVLGTRPEAIKLAPVISELRKHVRSGRVLPIVCSTGQHEEILKMVLGVFDVFVDLHLSLMLPAQALASLTVRALTSLDFTLQQIKPDIVVVQGDTTTAGVAAMAAFYHHIDVAHVEAGLRTYEKASPFPEEFNRRMIGAIAKFNFPATKANERNLLAEGTAAGDIWLTGNSGIDALYAVASKPHTPLVRSLVAAAGDRRLILLTSHRRENQGQPLLDICAAAKALVSQESVFIVYPVHPNPNVHDVVHAHLGGVPNVKLIPPLDYIDLVQLMKASFFILTDSGGIQEEGIALAKPMLVLRESTERQEGVIAGAAKLVGTDKDTIIEESRRLLHDSAAYEAMTKMHELYGDGHASERIVSVLLGLPTVGPFVSDQ